MVSSVSTEKLLVGLNPFFVCLFILRHLFQFDIEYFSRTYNKQH